MANTLADKLAYLGDTKVAIRTAITAKGVSVPEGTTFRAYADKIAEISVGVQIPSQEGNAGKFLSTDGTDLEWVDIGLQNYATTTALENAIAPLLTKDAAANTYQTKAAAAADKEEISGQLASKADASTVASTYATKEEVSAANQEQDTKINSNTSAINGLTTRVGSAEGNITTLTSSVDKIQEVIPAQASADNQLADKGFVNSTVQTSTANFRGEWATYAAIPTNVDEYPADPFGSKTPTVNDYLVVRSDETHDKQTWRYKYTGAWSTEGKTGWQAEYQVNDTALTAVQMDALNSNATKESIAQIGTNAEAIESLKGTKADKSEISDMLTKTEAGNTYETKVSAKAEHDALSGRIDTLSSSVQNTYATKSELADGLEPKADKTAIADMLTKTEAKGLYETQEAATEAHSSLSGEISSLTSTVAGKANTADVDAKYATKTAVSEINTRISENTEAITQATEDINSLKSAKADKTEIADMLTKSEAAGLYETKASAESTYNSFTSEIEDMLTKTTAAATYLTKVDASAKYATIETVGAINTNVSANAQSIEALKTGKQDKLTTAQLAAANSGITTEHVTQIDTNRNDISEALGQIAALDTDKQDKLMAGTNIEIKNNVISARVGVGRNIGEIFYTARLDNSLSGAFECNGTIFNVSDIEGGKDNLGALLARGALPYVSLEEHAAAIEQYGSCRAFGWDGDNVFAVPKLNDVYIKAGTAETPDEFLAEELPNITATPTTKQFFNQTRNSGGTDGAITMTQNGTISLASGNGQQGLYTMAFNASDANPVYKDGGKVQPDSVRYRPMVQLFTGVADDSVALATEVLADIAELKNMMGFVSGRFLVRKKDATADDPTWYEIYSDGKVAQGGRFQQTGEASNNAVSMQVDLSIPMADTTYSALLSGGIVVENTTGGGYAGIYAYTKTKTRLTVSGWRTAPMTRENVEWRVDGYADPSEYTRDKWNIRPTANGMLWLPTAPTANGTYSLGLVMKDGEPTPFWGQSFVRPPSAPERYLVRRKEPTATDPTWYNVYSDGWCRQGGAVGATAVSVVTFPIKFKDTNYSLANSNNMDSAQPLNFWYPTKEGFNPHRYNAANANNFSWEASGYADPTEYTRDKWGDDTDYSTISVMTGDPSPFKFKAWTNEGGETVYTLLAVPIARGDDMYTEDQLAVYNEWDANQSTAPLPKVEDRCGALGIVNGSRAINGGGVQMGTPGELDATTAYVRNQALDTDGPGVGLPGDDSKFKYKAWAGIRTVWTESATPKVDDAIYIDIDDGEAVLYDFTVNEIDVSNGKRTIITGRYDDETYVRDPSKDTNG